MQPVALMGKVKVIVVVSIVYQLSLVAVQPQAQTWNIALEDSAQESLK